MSPTLRLTISTPASVLVDAEAVVALRAEDESGSFGILPGHADFLTVLTPSVLRWHGAENVQRFCAVEEGVLRVSEGRSVTIACRNGVLGDSLAALEARIETVRVGQLDTARKARVEQTRLHAQAVRQLLHYLRPVRDDL
ncbi:F0F1 ATP synthase subunit epsilon [Paraburkholderia bryophila]|uniref:F0F1 ATP synthase subunit epsilon n=1 Tax=Paraburkholderia bryophila TaxID=420952 RepID=UPI0038BDE876